ncbi:hypothetical protein ACFX13_018128 [Malus domestica]
MKARHSLRGAIDLLFSRGSATAETYTRLVLKCVRANDVAAAKRLQSHMDLHSFQPTKTFVHNRILQLYAKYGNLADARNLFDKMPKRDIYSWNSMLSAYAKSGSLEELGTMFDQMPSRDLVSYNTVIAGAVANGCLSKALEAFVKMQEEGLEPSEHTFVSMLQACTRLLNFRIGKQIHGRVVVRNLEGNAFLLNALIDMYTKCSGIDQARWLFDWLVDKDVVSWNLMIFRYLKNGQPEKCIDLFRAMQASGLKPDQVAVSNVISAYFQTGNIVEAKKEFDGIKEKDKICWTTMIVGYAQVGREEDALILFGKMLLENVRPDSFTISSIVSSSAKLSYLYHGRVVHGKAVHMGVVNNLLVSSALVDMYCKCGVTEDARVVFELMPSRNVVSWNALITGYVQNGKDLEALALYENMLQEDIKPNNVTFVGVLSACVHANLIEEGQKYFDSISEQSGTAPTMDHYACMVCLLGHSGCIDKAVCLIESMPYEPNSLIWSTLLSVCAVKGDIEHAEMAAKHLFEFEPLSAGPYIILSNMYATSRRWEDVARIRSLMKDKNVKKFPAYSWIEIDNNVHKFSSEDRTHPETQQIYEELNKLIRKLQESGFTPNTKLVLHNVGEEEKFESICYHSEKLALAFGLFKKPNARIPIRIIKNVRVCGDCHEFMKLVSQATGRAIILRDSKRFHHFNDGNCSCKNCW